MEKTNPLFNSLMMSIAVITFGYFALEITREIFRLFQHHLLLTPVFLIWIVFFSPWLHTYMENTQMGSDEVKIMRFLIAAIVVIAGLACFFNGETFRDYLGRHYVDGYTVTYFPDTDDEGHDITGSAWHSESWIGSIVLYLSQWFCILLPAISLFAWIHFASKITNNISEREREKSKGYSFAE